MYQELSLLKNRCPTSNQYTSADQNKFLKEFRSDFNEIVNGVAPNFGRREKYLITNNLFNDLDNIPESDGEGREEDNDVFCV